MKRSSSDNLLSVVRVCVCVCVCVSHLSTRTVFIEFFRNRTHIFPLTRARMPSIGFLKFSFLDFWRIFKDFVTIEVNGMKTYKVYLLLQFWSEPFEIAHTPSLGLGEARLVSDFWNFHFWIFGEFSKIWLLWKSMGWNPMKSASVCSVHLKRFQMESSSSPEQG